MDLPIQKGKEGYIGLRDFSGMLIDWFQENGFIYHSRTTIWKNPVTEMQRTKALGLLHKTIKKDSSMTLNKKRQHLHLLKEKCWRFLREQKKGFLCPFRTKHSIIIN